VLFDYFFLPPDELLAVCYETKLYQIYPRSHVYVRAWRTEVRTNVTVMAKISFRSASRTVLTPPQNKKRKWKFLSATQTNTRKLGKITDHLKHLRREKKIYKQEGTCIRPQSVSKVTVKHLKTGLFLVLSQLQFPKWLAV